MVGLEPSCLLGFRDEIPALVKSDMARRLADQALLFEEFRPGGVAAGRIIQSCPLKPIAPDARWCTAIATRNHSTRWARSKRR